LKGDLADVSPTAECPPLEGRPPVGVAVISELDVECQFSLCLRIAAIGNLRHHLVAKIQSLTLDPRLFRRHQKSLNASPRLGSPSAFPSSTIRQR
jgi:hypothetical protein